MLDGDEFCSEAAENWVGTKTIRKVVDEEKEEKEVVKRDFLAFNSRLTM